MIYLAVVVNQFSYFDDNKHIKKIQVAFKTNSTRVFCVFFLIFSVFYYLNLSSVMLYL